MVFIETPVFTKLVRELLPDDEYRLLQADLAENPELGDIIRNSGGIRKARWGAQGRGKRGGVRVMYYWLTAHDKILMLFIYPKNERDDLSPRQLESLRRIVQEYENYARRAFR